MSNEMIPAGNMPAPFQRSATGALANVNQGSVAIEQERAIAEAQGQLVLAKRFPRDLTAAHGDLMAACKSAAFASTAFYSVPRAGGSVIGPSIRFAEEVARVFCNFQYGHRELSRSEGKSEVEVFAWDMQNNNRSIRQITVFHTRDTKNGAMPLRDQKDIDDKIANVASKQVRGRILALMPKWLVEEGLAECRKTLAGNNEEPIDVRVRRMAQAFAKFGVKAEHLERFLGHPLDQTLADEIADLQGVYNAIKEGTPPSEFFSAAEQADQVEASAAAITEAAKAGEERRGNAMAAKLAAAAASKEAPQPKVKEPAQSAHKGKAKAQESKDVKNDGKPEESAPIQTQTEVTQAAPEPTDAFNGGDGDIF